MNVQLVKIIRPVVLLTAESKNFFAYCLPRTCAGTSPTILSYPPKIESEVTGYIIDFDLRMDGLKEVAYLLQ